MKKHLDQNTTLHNHYIAYNDDEFFGIALSKKNLFRKLIPNKQYITADNIKIIKWRARVMKSFLTASDEQKLLTLKSEFFIGTQVALLQYRRTGIDPYKLKYAECYLFFLKRIKEKEDILKLDSDLSKKVHLVWTRNLKWYNPEEVMMMLIENGYEI